MNLQHLGTEYGGWTVDVDRIPEQGFVIDAGVGTDMSFAEGLHKLRPGLRFIMVDHTDEAEHFVTKVRGYDWATFVKKAIAPAGTRELKMFRHRTRSGSESCSDGHGFIDKAAPYMVPAISLSELILKYRPCLVKLDIESAEYTTIRECIGIPQVCCEFHHRMDSRYRPSDTDSVISDFAAAGYTVAHRTPTDEVLLVRG